MITRERLNKNWELVKSWKQGHKLEFQEIENGIWISYDLDVLPTFTFGVKWRIKLGKF